MGAQSLSPGTTREVPFFFLILKKILFILAVPGLLHCMRTFSTYGERGLLPTCSVRASEVASPAADHGLQHRLQEL